MSVTDFTAIHPIVIIFDAIKTQSYHIIWVGSKSLLYYHTALKLLLP